MTLLLAVSDRRCTLASSLAVAAAGLAVLLLCASAPVQFILLFFARGIIASAYQAVYM